MLTTDNYFALFDLSPSFEVDTALLAERYRSLQRQVHPDSHATGDSQERLLAVQNTAQLNEAFQTLKDPLKRGYYLLQMHGISPQNSGVAQLDTAFLDEQMTLRETLADLSQTADPSTALATFINQVQAQMQQLIQRLQQQFAQTQYRAAQDLLQRLQFFYKLREDALAQEEDLT